ncbi:YhcN/YlaJ family sporulation lipoprotein [Virgibacillus byunsanensis]|uniref:YhcN/YlaJ family sporulation lipoprotein n=1 Tax=Virgibacillus byunsanensis TaxID=570945 RepID=A0ABW3LMN0_9BACI
MYQKFLLLFITGILLAVTACGDTDSANDERVADEMDPLQDNEQNETQTDPGQNDRLGYVNFSKDELENDNERNHTATIDRTQLADMITRIILRSDGFEQVGTLVTDEEVLIAYRKDEETDSEKAAVMARKTAMSVLPRYFKIYVSENDMLMQDIQSLHNSTVDHKNYDNTIKQIIKEMEKTPQGLDNTMDE